MTIKRCGECPCISKKTTGGPIFYYDVYWCLKYDVKKDPNQEACAYAKERSSKGYKLDCK